MGLARHYLTELDLDAGATGRILRVARVLKAQRGDPEHRKLLDGRHVAIYFEKPSVRTRVSFSVGLRELGADPVTVEASATKVGRGEEVADFASVMGRYVHAIVARVFAQADLDLLAKHANVPVVNALSDQHHPCQALADLMTVIERKGTLEGTKIAFVGEGNNVAISLGLLGAAMGARVHVASPQGYGVPGEFLARAEKLPGELRQWTSVEECAVDADVLYTDTWISMGQEEDAVRRRELFSEYRLRRQLLTYAHRDAVIMHCLPAVRGEEIDADLMYGPHSGIWDQAENRLHVQKALMLHLLNPEALARLDEAPEA